MQTEQPSLETPSGTPTAETRELQLDGFVDERGGACIATFVGGFAAGWFFAVPESFKDALDIRLTQRVFDKTTETLWTQGKLYSFSHGDVFYDTPQAYNTETWSSALPHIGLCVQIEKAVPSAVIETKSYKTATPVQIIEDKKESPKKHLHQLSYTRSRISYGFVRFSLFVPDLLEKKLVQQATYETDQELLVRFLQSGLLRCNDGTEHDFRNRLAREQGRRNLELTPTAVGI